tara:strand:+ start:853 stop:1245 length:393 start_codon:yes stop_codon:yes gene_type:complete
MPNTNDSFITTLKKAHLEWGTHRHTNTRGIVYGEGYLQIPISEARRLDIYNSNQIGGNTVYTCQSTDGYFNNELLKSSGCIVKGNVYAKQFHGKGNLKSIGSWFNSVNAQIGDRVEITWTSPTDMIIRKI